MESLDPCLGLCFMLKNGNDLKDIEQSFSIGGKLKPLASIYKERPSEHLLPEDLCDSSIISC